MLANIVAWEPRRAALTVFAPHPDDEVLGCGGLIHAWAALGLPVKVVSVTDGEAADLERHDLACIRRQELRRALQALSPLPIRIERLAIPDGRVRYHEHRLRDGIIRHATPGSTILAPFEHDGHPDHEVVGRTCMEVAAARQIPLARYPVWMWHHTSPSALPALQWGKFELSSEAQAAKSRALACFESQLRPPTGAPIVPPHVLGYFSRSFEAYLL